MAKTQTTLPYRDARIPMPSKIAKGCYIDFEGFANPNQRFLPPVLIGCYRGGKEKDFEEGFHQVVFTNAYRWAAENADVPHQVIYDEHRDGFLRNLVDESSRGKPVFAYTEHEFHFLKNLGTRIERRYRNVHLIAKRWCEDNLSERPKDWSLKKVALAMGLDTTNNLLPGGVTERLRKVNEYSDAKSRWETAPKSVRKAWQEVLEHNRADVRLIYDMMNLMRPETGNDV